MTLIGGILGMIIGACATALWFTRARVLRAFEASVRGHRLVPIVAMTLDNITYLFTHGETEQVINAMRDTMEKQRAASGGEP